MPPPISRRRIAEFRQAFGGEINSLAALYRNAAANMLTVLGDASATLFARQRAVAQLRQYQTILGTLHDEAAAWIQTNIPRAYHIGLDFADEGIANIRKAGINLGRRQREVFSQVHREAAAAVVEEMLRTTDYAFAQIGRRVGDVFRRVGVEEVAKGIAEGTTRLQVTREIKARLLAEGKPFFVDRAGRQWDLDRYSEIVARTTTREAMTKGTTNRLLEHGIQLEQVSAHNAADFCCAPGTRVLTSHGWRVIERVQRGDLVMTHRGRWRPVTATMRRPYKGPLVKIAVLQVTPEHPILTERGWVQAGALDGRDQIILLERIEHHAGKSVGVLTRCNADDRIAQGVQLGISDTVSLCASLTVVPTAAVNLHDQVDGREEEVGDITLDGMLEDELHTGRAQTLHHRFLSGRWSAAISVRLARCILRAAAVLFHGIGLHALLARPLTTGLMRGVHRVGDPAPAIAPGGLRLDAVAGQPTTGEMGIVGAATTKLLRDIRQVGTLCHAAAQKVGESFAQVLRECSFGSSSSEFAVALGRAGSGSAGSLHEVRIRPCVGATDGAFGFHEASIEESRNSCNRYCGPVYNLSVQDDESYIAGGVVVHNCIYYENVIVSIGPEPHPVYPPISAINGGTPFHPKCAHIMTPFVERLATPEERAAGKIAPDLLNKSPAQLQRRFRKDFPERARAEGQRLRGQAVQQREARAVSRPGARGAPREKPKLPDVPFADAAQAEAWMHQHYPDLAVDFGGVHPTYLTRVASQWNEMAYQYPDVARHITYFGTCVDKQKLPQALLHTGAEFQGEWAHVRHVAGRGPYAADQAIIGLNPKWFGAPGPFEEALKSGAAESKMLSGRVLPGWHPPGCDTVEHVITHEFGHHVHDWYLNAPESTEAWTDVVAASGWGLVRDSFNLWWRGWATTTTATRSVSAYACTAPSEAFAEAFTALYHASPRWSNEYVDSLRQFLAIAGPSVRRYPQSQYRWLGDLPATGDARRRAWIRLEATAKRVGVKI